MEKLIITAAVSGSAPTKQQNPNVPYTPEEIANEALAAWRAGAAIAAARNGAKVAFIQDRPVLGGNGSDEIQVPPMGYIGAAPDRVVRSAGGDASLSAGAAPSASARPPTPCSCAPLAPALSTTPLPCAPLPWRRRIVLYPFRGVAVALELGGDPVHRVPVALGALTPIAELGQSLDRGLVGLQIEATDQSGGGIVRRWLATSLLCQKRCHGHGDQARGQRPSNASHRLFLVRGRAESMPRWRGMPGTPTRW